jgi:hypothetical protein
MNARHAIVTRKGGDGPAGQGREPGTGRGAPRARPPAVARGDVRNSTEIILARPGDQRRVV